MTLLLFLSENSKSRQMPRKRNSRRKISLLLERNPRKREMSKLTKRLTTDLKFKRLYPKMPIKMRIKLKKLFKIRSKTLEQVILLRALPKKESLKS